MTGVSTVLAPQESRVLESEDALGDEGAAPKVAVTEGVGMDTEMGTEQDADIEDKVNYGLD